jgi:hypothetical protein
LGIGEVLNGLLKSPNLRVFHDFMVAKSGGLRKSIIALICAFSMTLW